MQIVIGFIYAAIFCIPVFFVTLFVRLFKSEQKWHQKTRSERWKQIQEKNRKDH